MCGRAEHNALKLSKFHTRSQQAQVVKQTLHFAHDKRQKATKITLQPNSLPDTLNTFLN